MRAIFTVLLVLAAVSSAQASDRFSVTFLNPGGATGFWGSVSSVMRAATSDLDIDLEVIDTDRDRIRMLKAAESIAARAEKPDYVVLVNELEQGPAMARIMASARIPTFFLLNKLSDAQISQLGTDDADAILLGSVTPDNEIAGYEMAVSLIQATRARLGDDAPARILAILGDAVTPAALARQAGLERAVAEDPGAEIVRAFPVLWNREEARKRTSFALRVLEFDAVWGASDDIALGAAEAARAAGRTPGADISIAGLNWSREALGSVASGALTMSHGGHFFGGAWAMVMLRDLHDGANHPSDEVFEMSAVTPANVGLFIERFGDENWEKIDFSCFSKARGGRKRYDFSADAILAAAAVSERTALATPACAAPR